MINKKLSDMEINIYNTSNRDNDLYLDFKTLFHPLTSLHGSQEKDIALLQKLLKKQEIPRIIDLLKHTPSNLVHKSFFNSCLDVPPGYEAVLEVMILAHIVPKNRRQPYRIICKDSQEEISLIFFRGHAKMWQSVFPTGSNCFISGKIEHFKNNIQITHPEKLDKNSLNENIGQIDVIYPMTQGLKSRKLQSTIQTIVQMIPSLPEWIQTDLILKKKWPSWSKALNTIHNPETKHDLDPKTPSRERLAYDEILSTQLSLQIIRENHKGKNNDPIDPFPKLFFSVLNSLPFDLTESQKSALKDIADDFGSDKQMLRLIQGDVGSGKTVVALLAMTIVIAAGGQATIMAPTDILARQHYESFLELLKNASLKVSLLTGKDKGKKRKEILKDLQSGNIDILIGTHALFQPDVIFKNLRLAIIDEQHRFGVHQRLMLTDKGENTNLLVMTATPIPRTLLMINYGDLDVSYIQEKPKGRKPIETRLISLNRIQEVILRLKKPIENGDKIYWVCPLIEDSESLDLAAAEDRFASLQKYYGDRVGLVHGRMKAQEKEETMTAFKNTNLSGKSYDILVSTTVIEVGVNVPEACIMIIDHAERFGLSQLHQLRGRVGRGSKASTCLLLFSENINYTAKSRLNIMRETNDGFLIADEDLRLRGAGEILGTQQSGAPKFTFVDFEAHKNLLSMAKKDAQLFLEKDPYLQSDRGKALKYLLEFFERDKAVCYISSG